jgi:hypothetical protein
MQAPTEGTELAYAVNVDVSFTENLASGLSLPRPNLPAEVTLNLSLPPVSTETVSAAGNLIAVFVSPL